MNQQSEPPIQPGQDYARHQPPLGETPLYACRADPRCSFCLYLPHSHHGRETGYPLIVTMHGTGRRALAFRDAFAAFAEEHRCVVLAPLFPGGLTRPWEVDSYKMMKAGDLRFDELLLEMIDEVASVVRVETSRFLLHGFSGGGQFVHRFFYLHPDRLRGVSIGAPGSVTLLDDNRDWWVGVRDIDAQFGIAPNYQAMRQVPVQMVIGGDDTETRDITIQPNDGRWMVGANDAGITRLDRLATLRASFERHGITTQFDIVSGTSHEGFALIDPVKRFFAKLLSSENDRTPRA